MGAEEQIERLVEASDVLVPVHQQASQRGADVCAAANAHQRQSLDRVHEPAVMHGQAGRAKHAAEQQYVAGDGRVAHGSPAPRASARLRTA